MALINCPECNQLVSDTAVVCPHCGYSIKSFTDEQRAKDEIYKLAESVKFPTFPLFDTYTILDILLVILIIVSVIAFDVVSYPKVAIIGLIVIGIVQIFLLPHIIKKIIEYRLAKTNFEEYQVKMVFQDIKRVSRKRSTGIYFLSVLIPIVGIVLGIKSDPANESYNSTTCLMLGIISCIINGIIFGISQWHEGVDTMALITCPECKGKVSDTAKTCPHCGFELINEEEIDIYDKETTKKLVKVIGNVIYSHLLFLFLE